MNAESPAAFHLLPGTILEIAKEDWRYGSQPIRLLVEFVRLDLSTYYDNQWVWISGQRLARDGSPLGHLDALVRVAALPCSPGGSGRGRGRDAGLPGRDAGATGGRVAPRQRSGSEPAAPAVGAGSSVHPSGGGGAPFY